ncbi:hypothetical protein HYU10_03375 [Candidatus Woesearchaeota archaeon]|nr:hypothetical protein [Candidatus Woesearchaeota archaeon]MBI2660707.1 hypothetical protein [Candidatus Woesearchaeota archaeon]
MKDKVISPLESIVNAIHPRHLLLAALINLSSIYPVHSQEIGSQKQSGPVGSYFAIDGGDGRFLSFGLEVGGHSDGDKPNYGSLVGMSLWYSGREDLDSKRATAYISKLKGKDREKVLKLLSRPSKAKYHSYEEVGLNLVGGIRVTNLAITGGYGFSVDGIGGDGPCGCNDITTNDFHQQRSLGIRLYIPLGDSWISLGAAKNNRRGKVYSVGVTGF